MSELVIKRKPLSNKRQAFINALLTNGFNASKAYKSAYPGCNGGWDRLGHRLMIKDEIKQAIQAKQAELAEETKITVGLIQEKLLRNERLALESGDIAQLNRADELLGKTIGAYIDKQVSVDDVKRLTAREREEARKIATIRLRTG